MATRNKIIIDIDFFKNTALVPEKYFKELKKQPTCHNDLYYFVLMSKQKTLETYIQQDCKKVFDAIKVQYANIIDMDFMQIDNGGQPSYKNGHISFASRIRHNCEGTIAGASDTQLWFANKITKKTKIVNCEFKRIGNYKVDNKQIDFQKQWKDKYNIDGIITNNKVYFQEYVLNIVKELQND